MSLHRLLSFVLATCIALAVSGPQAIAKAQTASYAMQAGEVMDCCPGKHAPPSCPDCPLMALCASVFAAAVLPVAIATPVARIAARVTPTDEKPVIGRGASPPLEPPRS